MLSLLVGIDTEGDNQWSAEARLDQRFENLYALPRLNAIFQKHGVRPTYLITWPVARDPRSSAVLRELLSGKDCEVGAHHHAWETPPCTGEDVRRHGCQLSASFSGSFIFGSFIFISPIYNRDDVNYYYKDYGECHAYKNFLDKVCSMRHHCCDCFSQKVFPVESDEYADRGYHQLYEKISEVQSALHVFFQVYFSHLQDIDFKI